MMMNGGMGRGPMGGGHGMNMGPMGGPGMGPMGGPGMNRGMGPMMGSGMRMGMGPMVPPMRRRHSLLGTIAAAAVVGSLLNGCSRRW